ncbi:hypothetical protein L1D54_12670 [Vibrio brasiliensis]|uniref:tRNA-guanine transglycosylase DpdA n=1 Tax=Vibrio brasiliensis TaxID=170652 RepID=UPI001EFE657C|nr:tRNA-guanine transglycosylase DpdA [Vibrio brasiliensis]MCG9751339.1 hypothetical protein [Vibrio brasiliensis]
MKFFFPDSQDFINPTFDFISEKKKRCYVRQRDDKYAHELMQRPYDGILISKAIVEGIPGQPNKTRYSEGQRYRLYREGAHRFFRLGSSYEVMGDSGAFSYLREPQPPYSVDDLIEFYVKLDVNQGVSLDHVVFGYRDERSRERNTLPADKDARVEMTLENANEFLKQSHGLKFKPYGVAQGWDVRSYMGSVVSLQKMGYQYITLGGVVTLDSGQLCHLLESINPKLKSNTKLHLLGIGRLELIEKLKSLSVYSIDTTTPLKQAFLNKTKNYRLGDTSYSALRVPQSSDNQVIKRAILAGRLDQTHVKNMENRAMRALRAYDADLTDVETTLERVLDYERLLMNHREVSKNEYRRTLQEKPWRKCGCPLCQELGIEVVIYRGAERNKRRGFHNLHDFYKQLLRSTK